MISPLLKCKKFYVEFITFRLKFDKITLWLSIDSLKENWTAHLWAEMKKYNRKSQQVLASYSVIFLWSFISYCNVGCLIGLNLFLICNLLVVSGPDTRQSEINEGVYDKSIGDDPNTEASDESDNFSDIDDFEVRD